MHLSGKYAMYYNRHHGYSGHVFERRYKPCVVSTDEYFLQTSRYIHLNPVKAKMAVHTEDYRFSSYKTFLRLLDALRQPIEDKKVCISRVNGTHTFPSNFMFVTAMNPCPCGYYPSSKCRCTDYEIIKYRGKISGPIMDRIDIQKEVKPVNYFALEQEDTSASSAEIQRRVEKARKIQQRRYKNDPGINNNAQMSTAMIQRYCTLDKESRKLLKETCESYVYSNEDERRWHMLWYESSKLRIRHYRGA